MYRISIECDGTLVSSDICGGYSQAIGLLIGMEDLEPEKQSDYLSSLLTPLCHQVTVRFEVSYNIYSTIPFSYSHFFNGFTLAFKIVPGMASEEITQIWTHA